MPQSLWNNKQRHFCIAIQRYEEKKAYKLTNQLVSWVNVALQFILICLALNLSLSFGWHIFAFVIAYVLADFFNGLVHLYMDHNDNYTSIVGPFVAAFHLHHDMLFYKHKPLWQVYVDESGYKLWLVFYLLIVMSLFLFSKASPLLLSIAVYFGVLSSVAEVSHYLCHNSNSDVVRRLQRYRILLPKKHHMQHHKFDNVSYAFLNGITDPLINWIAACFFHGYKTNTDQHTALYKYNQNLISKN